MRVRIPARLATGKICTAMLLAVVPIALVIPGGKVALSQNGTGIAAQPPLFTAIDLNPSGFIESWASGISGGQQVGGSIDALTHYEEWFPPEPGARPPEEMVELHLEKDPFMIPPDSEQSCTR